MIGQVSRSRFYVRRHGVDIVILGKHQTGLGLQYTMVVLWYTLDLCKADWRTNSFPKPVLACIDSDYIMELHVNAWFSLVAGQQGWLTSSHLGLLRRPSVVDVDSAMYELRKTLF